ncbi:hypothetical protein M3Y98_00875600 [Aphelenchoides besseyi]|nr:hypothetical protein M3Y98_00875600 [Aphelenchoides besseyi]
MLKRQKNLLVRDWKENVISLIQYPRAGAIPSISPWSLKLETWLRITQLDYTVKSSTQASQMPLQNVSNEFKIASQKGQVPFIEVNGRQIADSNFIIDQLKQMYNLSIDRELNTREQADARAYQVLVEESLLRALFYHRSRDMSWITSEKGVIGHFHGFKKTLLEKLLVKNICNVQGIGRHAPPEVDQIAKKDLNALSTFLGDKPYFFGSAPTTLDATAFGTLAEIYFIELKGTDIKEYMETSTPNLVNFVQLIKKNFWPDWDILTSQLIMNQHEAKTPNADPISPTT